MNTKLAALGINIPTSINIMEILDNIDEIENITINTNQKKKIRVLKNFIDEYNRRPLEKPTIIKSPMDCYKAIRTKFRDLDIEELHIAVMRRNKLIKTIKVSTGSWDQVLIDVKQIILKIIENKCNSAILIHNHPSGNPLPSESDINQTKKLKDAMKCMELTLIDHIIMSPGSFYSFAEEEVHYIQN